MEWIKKANQLGTKRKPFLFVIDFEIENYFLYEIDKIPPHIFLVMGAFQILPKNIEKLPSSIFFNKYPIDFQIFKQSFEKIQEEQRKGNSFLTNLTFATPIETNLSLEQIFYYSRAKYKLLVSNYFTVFSPETFIKIKNGEIFTYPMKGTIDASLPDAEKILLENEKEQAEHTTVVDLLRNDLGKVASCIEVKKYRYIDVVQTMQKTLLQTSSEIKGILPHSYHTQIGDILWELLPAGSISGAPKKKTVEIIQSTEKEKRGFYTGIFGVFDGENLESAVMIRFIEQRGKKMYYRSGVGITVESNCLEEYQEMVDKIYVPIY